ncbi:MAG: hypothetical protein ISS70_12720 [Phycisphaerae bacterium]|nr:hypothetical protein [Phycisphaerae bacterium]
MAVFVKRKHSTIIIFAFLLLGLIGGFGTPAGVQAKDESSPIERLSQDTHVDSSTASEQSEKEEKDVEEAKQQAAEAEIEAQTAKKAVEIQEEAVEVQKEKAKVAEAESKIALERTAIGEGKIGKPRNGTYTKLFQTGLIILAGYAPVKQLAVL